MKNDLIPKIKSPKDIKKFTLDELSQLCDEIRKSITTEFEEDNEKWIGDLRTVELTVALNYIFDFEVDRQVCDAPHLWYTHKILNGTGVENWRESSGSGMSTFETSQPGSSISAALALATARDLAQEKYQVIAVINEDALTTGLSFEGLNSAGEAGRDLIIVLNENKSPGPQNISAMARYLTNIITNPRYNRVKADIWNLTGKIPKMTRSIRMFAHRVEESLKNLVVPGMLFEELGFRYIGPFDGTNLPELVSKFTNIGLLRGPILVHVLTDRNIGDNLGRQQNSVTGRKIEAVATSTSQKAVDNILVEIAERDDRVSVVNTINSTKAAPGNFKARFPNRFFDVGIAEQHAVTFAAGLTTEGERPIITINSAFLQKCYDQIIHDVGVQHLPVIFCIDEPGAKGSSDSNLRGALDLSCLGCVPNFIISVPKDEIEFRNLLLTALDTKDNAFVIRYPTSNSTTPGRWGKPILLRIGSWELLLEGKDVVILAVGSMVKPALEAAERITTKGISTGVINCRFVKPLDEEMLKGIAKSSVVMVTVEENSVIGGFGAHVSHVVNSLALEVTPTIHNLGIPDNFISAGISREKILEEMGLTADGIENFISSLLR